MKEWGYIDPYAYSKYHFLFDDLSIQIGRVIKKWYEHLPSTYCIDDLSVELIYLLLFLIGLYQKKEKKGKRGKLVVSA